MNPENEPNEFGFAGAASGPEVDSDRERKDGRAERLAVPAEDLTSGLRPGPVEPTASDREPDGLARR